jgi:hypothetical protein
MFHARFREDELTNRDDGLDLAVFVGNRVRPCVEPGLHILLADGIDAMSSSATAPSANLETNGASPLEFKSCKADLTRAIFSSSRAEPSVSYGCIPDGRAGSGRAGAPPSTPIWAMGVSPSK